MDHAKDLLMKLSDDQLDRLAAEWEEEAPASAANADEGKAEHVDHDVSASTITENGGNVK